MATIRVYRGKWRAQIRRKGYTPLSGTFLTKSAAKQWARKTESEIERKVYLDLYVE